MTTHDGMKLIGYSFVDAVFADQAISRLEYPVVDPETMRAIVSGRAKPEPWWKIPNGREIERLKADGVVADVLELPLGGGEMLGALLGLRSEARLVALYAPDARSVVESHMETPALDRLMHFVQDALNPRWGLDKQRRIDLDAVLPEAQRELANLKQAAGKGDDGGGASHAARG